MTGLVGPSEALPRGGWATGDAAAAAGLDLRLFFKASAGGVGGVGCDSGARHAR